MTDQTRVIGAPELASSLHRAADDIGDMSRAGEQTGRLIANRGRVVVPRLSGALAASIGSRTDHNNAEVFSALPYAARTHYGYARYRQRAQPFLMDPATQLVPVWSGYYTAEADRILHTVKGA